MKHEEFQIGKEFWCGGRRWRCTDVGTRTIVAISMESHYIIHGGKRTETTDESWLAGPPYAVAEDVFDEHAIQGCQLTLQSLSDWDTES